MANPVGVDSHISTEEAPQSVSGEKIIFQNSLHESFLKDHESAECSNATVRAGDESAFLSSSCNNPYTPETLSSQREQEDTDGAFDPCKAELSDRRLENTRDNEGFQIALGAPQASNLSTALDTNNETEESFCPSPIKYVLSYQSSDGTRMKDEVVQNIKSLEPRSQDQQSSGDAVLEVTRVVIIQDTYIDSTKSLTDQNMEIDRYGPCVIQINSIAIINALNSVVSYWPGLNLNTSSLRIQEPFAILYHHRKALEEYADSKTSDLIQKDGGRCEREKEIDKDLKLLFDFLDIRPEAKKIYLERERHKRPKIMVTFEMLWVLLSPGTDVFCDHSGTGKYEGYVVKHISGGSLNMEYATPYTVTLWHLEYNDERFGRREYWTKIQPFTGEKEIDSLSLIPCDLYKRVEVGQTSQESKSLRQTFVGYGEKFVKLARRQCVQYSGETYSFPRKTYHSRVIVDNERFYRENIEKRPELNGLEEDKITAITQCLCSYCESNNQAYSLQGHESKFSDYEDIRPGACEFVDLTDHQKFLCTHEIHGFVLSSRSWQILDIANIMDCQWDRSMIDKQLSIDEGDRHMIKGLVQGYFLGRSSKDDSKRRWDADFKTDKGNSQIFLLHGKPGVGKTFTAECVAEFLQRPLLSLSCSDVGVESAKVEENLGLFFKRAKLWGAVMLIDEADVYLEQRTSRDLERNCLVAIFLRCLEYYEGILFLTTNRVGAFDDALVSRINVVLHYEFDEARRQDVWTTFFCKLERDRERGRMIKVPYSTREYTKHDPDLRRLEWNGREIRNAFHTAVAMAEYSNVPDPHDGLITLQEAHFQQVVRMSSNFARYLRKVHGAEPEKVAAGRRDRNEYTNQRDTVKRS